MELTACKADSMQNSVKVMQAAVHSLPGEAARITLPAEASRWKMDAQHPATGGNSLDSDANRA